MEARKNGDLPGKLYFEACDQFPQDLQLYVKHIDSPGDDYLEHVEEYNLHPWPQGGAIIIGTKLPR